MSSCELESALVEYQEAFPGVEVCRARAFRAGWGACLRAAARRVTARPRHVPVRPEQIIPQVRVVAPDGTMLLQEQCTAVPRKGETYTANGDTWLVDCVQWSRNVDDQDEPCAVAWVNVVPLLDGDQ